jgi:hypothetical protein
MRQGLIDAIYEVYSDHDGDGSDEVEDYADAVVLYVAGWLRDGYEQGGRSMKRLNALPVIGRRSIRNDYLRRGSVHSRYRRR